MYGTWSLQLCLWSIDSWDKRKSVPIQLPAGKAPSGDTRVQFHADQVRLLVSHETQLAIYDASKMERIRQVKQIPNLKLWTCKSLFSY